MKPDPAMPPAANDDERRCAAVGRFVLQERHQINNALTTVLGNAELLLLNGSLSPEAREQLESIHHMGMRLHQIMQRLMALESELKFAARSAAMPSVASVKVR